LVWLYVFSKLFSCLLPRNNVRPKDVVYFIRLFLYAKVRAKMPFVRTYRCVRFVGRYQVVLKGID